LAKQITVIWDMTPYNLLEMYPFIDDTSFIFSVEERNVDTVLPDYMAPHFRML